MEIEINDLWAENFGDMKKLKEKMENDKKNKGGLWAEPLMFTGHRDK